MQCELPLPRNKQENFNLKSLNSHSLITPNSTNLLPSSNQTRAVARRAGLLGRARLIEKSPPRSGLSRSGTALFLKPFPSLSLFSRLSDSLLPLLFLHWRRRLGERRRHMSRLRPALCRRRASTRYARPPSLSFCCARRSTPNPNKTYLYSDLSPVTVYYLLTSISFAKIVRCTFVYTHVLC